jgi:hypothetical protein
MDQNFEKLFFFKVTGPQDEYFLTKAFQMKPVIFVHAQMVFK